MKRKRDFVTNSSSVSFCIFGQQIDKNNLPLSVIEKIYEYKKENDIGFSMSFDEFKNKRIDIDLLEDIGSIEKNGKIRSVRIIQDPDCYCYYCYIGMDITDIEQDQTRREFENEVRSIFEKMGFDPHKCHIIEDSWYDG